MSGMKIGSRPASAVAPASTPEAAPPPAEAPAPPAPPPPAPAEAPERASAAEQGSARSAARRADVSARARLEQQLSTSEAGGAKGASKGLVFSEGAAREHLTRLVDQRFGGDWQRAFRHYAGGDSVLNRAELERLCSDADISNAGMVADAVMGNRQINPNGDRTITFDEARAVFTRR